MIPVLLSQNQNYPIKQDGSNLAGSKSKNSEKRVKNSLISNLFSKFLPYSLDSRFNEPKNNKQNDNRTSLDFLGTAGDIAGSCSNEEGDNAKSIAEASESQSEDEIYLDEFIDSFIKEDPYLNRKNPEIEFIKGISQIHLNAASEINSLNNDSDSESTEQYMQFLRAPSYVFKGDDSTNESLRLEELENLRDIASQLAEQAYNDYRLISSLGCFWGYASSENRELENLGSQIHDKNLTEKQVVDKMKRIVDLIYKGYSQISGFKIPQDYPIKIQKLMLQLTDESRRLGILNETESGES